MRRIGFLFFSLFLFALQPLNAQKNEATAPHVHVRLAVLRAPVVGGEGRLAVDFKLDAGWHVYWKNPGDAGEAPRVKWTLPAGVTVGDFVYPVPKRLPLGPLMDFGYEGEVAFPVALKVARSVQPRRVTIPAHVSWLVCSSSCIPGKADLEVAVDVLAAGAKAAPTSDEAAFAALKQRFPTVAPKGLKAVFESSGDVLKLSVETGQRETAAEFFPAEAMVISHPAPEKFAATAKGFVLELKKDADLKSAPKDLKGLLVLSGGRAFEIAATQGKVVAASEEKGLTAEEALRIHTPLAWDSSLRPFADAPHIHVELVQSYKQLSPTQNNVERHLLGIYFKIDKGWHIYWKNAGDAGMPPKVQWTLPDNAMVGELQFAAPKRIVMGPLTDYGYEDEVVFPAILTGDTPKAMFGVAVPFKAHVNWIVCSSSCIPGKADLESAYDWSGGDSKDRVSRPTETFLESTYLNLPSSLPAQAKTVFSPTKDGYLLDVETGQRESSAEFFPLDAGVIQNAAEQKFWPTAKGFQLELKGDQFAKNTPNKLAGLIELSGGRNYEFAAVQEKVVAVGGVRWLELLRIAGLALLGGIILNLMPCVFPVLFLKGLSLVNSGAEERGRLRLHGLVYAAGILASFWALVAALLILRATGAHLGWGFQFQSPVFLGLMAGLIFFLGLSLAGQFEIGLTLTSAGGELAQKQGFAGSFFTGVLAVVVATPCAAPFMGVAVGYALAQSAPVTLAIFTALAVGLALPYLLLTLQPAWTRVLPRPGVWMEILKQATALPLFGTVIWLVWVVASTYGAALLVALLGSFVLLAVAGWFLGRWPTKKWATIVAGVVLVAAVAVMAIAPSRLAESQATTVSSGSDWQPWSAAAVEKARAEGRPVFVDFTAKWCLSCQVNERVALTQPEVMAEFRAKNVLLLKADWTEHDAAIQSALEGLGRSGVPTYALYKKGAKQAELLPEALTPGIVLDALK